MERAKHARPIVIMGTGIPAVCALINKFADITFNAPDDGPAINVFVLDTMDRRKPDESAVYPLHGISIDAIHPFKTREPAPGFPRFGEYAREMAEEDPAWQSALHAPTFRHVNEYVEYMLQLAVGAMGAKAIVEAGKKPVQRIEEPVANGAATIYFTDGTFLHATQIVRAGKPPHMSGPDSTLATFFPPVDPRIAISQMVDLVWPPPSDEEHNLLRMIAAHAEDANRQPHTLEPGAHTRAFWEVWPFRMAAFKHALTRAFGARRKERDAIEAEVTRLVGARVNPFDFPGDDPGGWFRNRVERYLKVIDAAADDEDEVGGMAIAAAREFAEVMGGRQELIQPIAEKDFRTRYHSLSRSCSDLALNVDP